MKHVRYFLKRLYDAIPQGSRSSLTRTSRVLVLGHHISRVGVTKSHGSRGYATGSRKVQGRVYVELHRMGGPHIENAPPVLPPVWGGALVIFKILLPIPTKNACGANFTII